MISWAAVGHKKTTVATGFLIYGLNNKQQYHVALMYQVQLAPKAHLPQNLKECDVIYTLPL